LRDQRVLDELVTVVEQLLMNRKQRSGADAAPAERQCRLHETREQLLRAERLAALGEFAATLAHELRTPLNIIRLASSHISSELAREDEFVHRHISQLSAAVDRACGLIDDLLRFAQLTPHQQKPTAVNDVVRDAIAMLDVPRPVKVDWSLACDLPLVTADPLAISQAIESLARNALQAMPEGGRLTIATRPVGSHVEIILSDTGPGIPVEIRDRIFEPFFTTHVSGSGLGLPLVRAIVAAHHGHLSVESAPGEGARFTLSLPAGDTSVTGAQSAEQGLQPAHFSDTPVTRGWNPDIQ
jgi:signal transduction histidine kinase